jgi:DUF1009 family protein
MQDMSDQTLGIIAGAGQFPILIAKAARDHGKRVVAVAHTGETLPELEEFVDQIKWIRVGQLGRLIKAFKQAGVSQAVMCGGITKAKAIKDMRFDLKALTLVGKLKRLSDDGILRTLCGVLEKNGIKILPSHVLLPELLATPGVYTKRGPTADEEADAKMGWEVAGELGRFDVGQCAVVRARMVVALEALEGTDACIKRAGEISRPGMVVVKRCKPIQDERFDLPAVGTGTLRTMKRAGAGCLLIEAGRSLVFDREAMVEMAEQAGICIMAWEN